MMQKCNNHQHGGVIPKEAQSHLSSRDKMEDNPTSSSDAEHAIHSQFSQK